MEQATNDTPPALAEIASVVRGKKVPSTTEAIGYQTVNTAVDRKIIYTASMELVVEQFDSIDKQIQQTIAQHDGYVARVNLDQMQGERRTGHWTARIPVDRYQEFLDAVAELGVPASQEQSAQDVTEEFVDLTARIANEKRLETRILELLDRPKDEIQYVIEVERELARVRQQIEQMEGRLRFLSDQTALTTVNISVREERNYQPPQAPTLGNRIASAWNTSISETSTASGNLVVALVGSLIPLTIIAALFVLFWFAAGRRIWKWLPTTDATSPDADATT